MRFSGMLMGARPRGEFAPGMLGASLLAFWDAEASASVSLSGSAVTSWADLVTGAAPAQATAGSRPAWSASSFNGRPGVTFDGVDDILALESCPLPIGGTPCEIWALVSQGALVADTTSRNIFRYGATAAAESRSLGRVVLSGANRMRANGGDGITAAPADELAADFSGVRLLRARFQSTLIRVSVDGGAWADSAAIAPALATVGTRTCIGGSTVSPAANFFQGVINAIVVTALLSDADAAPLIRFLVQRKGGA